MNKAYLKYSSSILLAIENRKKDLAAAIYYETERLPRTETIQQLGVEGVLVNGELYPGSPLLICFKDDKTCVLKNLDEGETERVRAFHEALAGQMIPGITPFELKHSVIHGRTFMIMPKFASTLEQQTYLSEAGATSLWRCLSAALEAIHALGFAHMDVKPANICFNAASKAVLIDLGLCTVVFVVSEPAHQDPQEDSISNLYSAYVSVFMDLNPVCVVIFQSFYGCILIHTLDLL